MYLCLSLLIFLSVFCLRVFAAAKHDAATTLLYHRDGIIQVADIWVEPDTVLGSQSSISRLVRRDDLFPLMLRVLCAIWQSLRELSLVAFYVLYYSDGWGAEETTALLFGSPISAEDCSSLTVVTWFLLTSGPFLPSWVRLAA